MKVLLLLFAWLAAVVGLASFSQAPALRPRIGGEKLYQVGPTRQHTQVSQVASLLNPGDVVEVDGDFTYQAVRFSRPGAANAYITIRGIRVNGRRPTFAGNLPSPAPGFTIYMQTPASNVPTQNGYYIFEGLEVTGGTEACIRNQARDVIYRDMKVYNCPRHGLLSHDWNSGNLTISFVEFTGIGGTYASENVKHPLYITTDQKSPGLLGSRCRVEYSYFHHNVSGNNIKSRCERNEIFYNWIESAETYELDLIGGEESDLPVPHDSDVVGNVILGAHGYVMNVGSDGHSSSNGRYRFVNNTIVSLAGVTNNGIFRWSGNIQSIEFINNIIYRGDDPNGDARLVRQGDWGGWLHGDQCTGRNNWISNGITTKMSSSGCGQVLANATRGTTPGFVNASSSLPSFNPQLLANAAAVNIGTIATTNSNPYPIPASLAMPTFHPSLRSVSLKPEPRPAAGTIDVGAFEVVP